MDTQTPQVQSETDAALIERGRGQAERLVLGNNPLGSMARLVIAAALFILVFGTLFYLMQQ